jgi:rfaE bifunctional protein kinase chain/domain
MSAGPLVVVGDLLLDRDLTGHSRRLSPDAAVPVLEDVTEQARPGGAGLAALLAARDGLDVVLVSALGTDDAATLLRTLLAAELQLAAVEYSGPTTQKVRIQADDRPLLRVDLGNGNGQVGPLDEAARHAISRAGAVLVADYGRGVTAHPEIRAEVARRVGTVPVVWDPHPRGTAPVPGVTLATPNLAEARHFAGDVPCADDEGAARSCASRLRTSWRAAAVAVTLGRRGAVLGNGDSAPLLVPPAAACHGDPCGAGDRFSAAVTAALQQGATPADAVRHAVAVSARYVVAGGPASLGPHRTTDCTSLAPPAMSAS